MIDPNDPQGPQDPFEQELGERMDRMVRYELPPFDLAARARARAGAVGAASRRRALVRGGGVALLAAAVVAAVALVGVRDDGRPELTVGDDGRPVTTVAPSTTSSSSTTSTTVDDGDRGDDGDDDRDPADRGSSRTTPPTTALGVGGAGDPVPERRCFAIEGEPNDVRSRWESDDSGYGPAAYWRTQPAPDQPITGEVCIDDVTPEVGQVVTVTATVVDPDQGFSSGSCTDGVTVWAWGDEEVRIMSLCGDALEPPPEAPGPTPGPEPRGELTRQLSHTYAKAGTFTIEVHASSGSETGRPEPHRSWAERDIPITVRP